MIICVNEEDRKDGKDIVKIEGLYYRKAQIVVEALIELPLERYSVTDRHRKQQTDRHKNNYSDTDSRQKHDIYEQTGKLRDKKDRLIGKLTDRFTNTAKQINKIA